MTFPKKEILMAKEDVANIKNDDQPLHTTIHASKASAEQIARLTKLKWHGHDLDQCIKETYESRGQVEIYNDK